MLCPSEGPGSGVPPQGKLVFCVFFLSCFLVTGTKAPICWICKALGITPASGKGGNRRLCLAVFLSGCSFTRLMAPTPQREHCPADVLGMWQLCVCSHPGHCNGELPSQKAPSRYPVWMRCPQADSRREENDRCQRARARQDLGPPPYAGNSG